MISIGVDAHKRVHVAAALDAHGRELGSWRGPNSAKGWDSFAQWLESLGDERRIGIEGAWSYGRQLAQTLVARGERVYEVNTRWTAAGRLRARRVDKSDRLDARAVAAFILRESDALSTIAAEDQTSVLDLLTVEREATLAEATRLRNQIHALLLQLDPEYKRSIPNLTSKSALATLRNYQGTTGSAMSEERAAAVRRLTVRLELALQQAEDVAKRIRSIAEAHFAPLTEICGVHLLTAGALAGILGPGARFNSDAALAAYAGVAPREASSAGKIRHRLNRGGNRRLNAVLYRIVLTQAHASTDARSYLARRQQEGKTKREAMRALKRYVVRAIWRLWVQCHPEQLTSISAAA